MTTFRVDQVVEFAELLERLNAQLEALPGSMPARLTLKQLQALLIVQGADMPRLFRKLTKDSDSDTTRRLQDLYADLGFDTGLEGY